jgi:hypothetical protein
VAASAFGTDRRRSSRAALATLVAAAHLAAIVALLAPDPPPDAEVTERELSVFDVAVPPPAPPPAPPVRSVPVTERVRLDPGGSPRDRPAQAAPPTEHARDAAPRRFDATITADALPLPPSGQLIDAPGIDLGLDTAADRGGGGADGHGGGTGTGQGTGSGAGDEFARYGRARWLVRPTDADFYRVWPAREVDGKLVRQPGWAYLACKVTHEGQPHDCQALYETPASIGMGAAEIDVATRSRVRPVFRNGKALLDLPVLIPIVFGVKVIRLPRVSAAVSAPRAR